MKTECDRNLLEAAKHLLKDSIFQIQYDEDVVTITHRLSTSAISSVSRDYYSVFDVFNLIELRKELLYMKSITVEHLKNRLHVSEPELVCQEYHLLADLLNPLVDRSEKIKRIFK